MKKFKVIPPISSAYNNFPSFICIGAKKCCSSSWLTISPTKYNLNTFVESISLTFFLPHRPSGLLSSIAINRKWYCSETERNCDEYEEETFERQQK